MKKVLPHSLRITFLSAIVFALTGSFFFLTSVEAGRTCCVNGYDPSTCETCGDVETKNYGDSCGGAPNCRVCPSGRPVANACGGSTCTASCGGCSVSCGGGTRTCTRTDCSTYTENCNTQACCTNSAPIAPALSSPVNGTQNIELPMTLSWLQNGGWGTNCPTNTNRYLVRFRPKGTTCTGGTYVDLTTLLNSSTTSFSVGATTLNYNTTYCWYVRKSNGSTLTASSSPWEFTTRALPSLDGVSVLNDVCGNDYSGRLGNPGVSNPVRFKIDISDTFDFANAYAVIGLVPRSGPVAGYLSEANFNTRIANASSFSLAINVKTGQLLTLNSLGAWVAIPSSGNQTTQFGNARILNIGVPGGTTWSWSYNASTGRYMGSAEIQVEFTNTFPSRLYDVYATAETGSASGTLRSAFATATEPIRYSDSLDWGVDVNNPGVTISSETYRSDGSYDITWTINEPSITSITSGITAAQNGSALTDRTTGQNFSWPAGGSELNAGITTGELDVNGRTSHNYYDTQPQLGSDYTYRLSAADIACNTGLTTQAVNGTKPWIMLSDNTVSSSTGFDGVEIPNVTITIPVISAVNQQAYFGENLVISGASVGVDGLVSFYKQSSGAYPNRAFEFLATNTNYPTWFAYLYNLALQKEEISIEEYDAGELTQISAGQIERAGTGNFLKRIGAGGEGAWLIPNSLTINSGVVCNTKGVVFVNGNLTVEPDFTNQDNQSRCLFIVSGNVSIGNGTRKTAVALTSTALANYDIIDMYIVSDGAVSSALDYAVPTTKGDGLLIRGGVISEDFLVGRDINRIGNNLQPAMIIQYDPSYLLFFQDIFEKRSFSIQDSID